MRYFRSNGDNYVNGQHARCFTRRVRIIALATNGIMGTAYANCTDSGASASADGGSACQATRTAYTNGTNALLANDLNSVLNVLGDVVLNLDENSATTGNRAVAMATGNGGALNFEGTLEIHQWGYANSYGLAAGGTAGGSITGWGTVTAEKDVSVIMLAGDGTCRAIISLNVGSQVTIGGYTHITATGGSVHRGISAEAGGHIQYTSTLIDFTDYADSIGLRCSDPGSLIHATGDTVVQMNGQSGSGSGNGVRGTSGGQFQFDGRLAVEITGNNSAAIALTAANDISMGANFPLANTSSTGSAVNLSGTPSFTAGEGLTISAGKSAFLCDGAASTITLSNATVTAPGLWNASNSSAASFTALGGTYMGTSVKDGGSTLDIALNAGARWNMDGDSELSTLALTAGTLDAAGGSYSLTATDPAGVNNAGSIDLHGVSTPSTGEILTIVGNYAGSGGNTVRIDAQLGGNGSPADVLHVVGDTSGATTLQAVNLGGTGAATTGDGILVVQVDGASDATFTLPGGAVRAGNWRYTLARGSGVDAGNWYL